MGVDKRGNRWWIEYQHGGMRLKREGHGKPRKPRKARRRR